MKKLLLASALFVVSVSPAFAARNPWVGTWKPDYAKSNYIEVTGPLVISTPSPGIMRWEYPTIETTLEGKPDGSAMSIRSPHLPKGIVETVKLLTPMKLTYRIFVNGRLDKHGTDEISADGSTFTATSWIGRSHIKLVEVFDRE